jgi:DNA polymerase-4
MALPINRNQPLIMHVDLNSCFATIEQQANPLLRGKPIVVAAYNSPNGCLIAPSIEAKRYGIKTDMTVRDAKLLYPQVIVRTPDPAKYRTVHLQFRKIFKDYSPNVSPKSIDEAVIDFTDTYALYNRSLTDIGQEIKRRFREEIGEWMVCSIGISTNRFLAKLAASLQKPDGLTVIDHTNVLKVY